MTQARRKLLLVVALAVVALGAVGYAVARSAPFQAWLAVRDIEAGRNVGEARATLELLNDRQTVLDAIDAALEAEGTVRGKVNLLQTLAPGAFNQPRAIRRALHAPSAATRRAACSLLYGDPELKARCAEIAMEWLQDESADERHKAAMICGQLDVEGAEPILVGILARTPRTHADLLLLQQALSALRGAEVEGLTAQLMAMVKNEELDDTVRGNVLQTLEHMEDTPREELLRTALGMLEDPEETFDLRQKAALALGQFRREEAWQALERLLLDDDLREAAREQDRAYGPAVLQRACLMALCQSAPLDRVRQLLLDRRIYAHPYFGVRVDVAVGLAALNAREGIVLDIMGEYLVDQDPRDTQHIVRSEAWLTLWVLTGVSYGAPQPELFRVPPRPIPDLESHREYLNRRGPLRAGISPAQANVIEEMADDLATMQRIRETFGNMKHELVQRWEQARKPAAEEKDKEITPQGPPPPPEDDEERDGGGEDGGGTDDGEDRE